MKAMLMFGQLSESDLPPFLRPLRNLVFKVTKLFNDIKTDIMNFYNVSIFQKVVLMYLFKI